MKNDEFLKLVQKRLANTSIGASTAHGEQKKGEKGLVKAAQGFLVDLPLKKFHVNSNKKFQDTLDNYTDEFRRYMQKKGKTLSWGAARKFLNIYLREILYNKYLSPAYKFDNIQNYLELPLDSHVAEGLRNEKGGKERLRRWQSIKGLNPETNREYQQFASEVAEKKQTCRIHLDLEYWRRDEKKKTRS